MSRRWFTADFHLGMTDILRFENRPFKTIEKHDAALIRSCNQRAKTYTAQVQMIDSSGHPVLDSNGNPKMTSEIIDSDTIVHLGDFCSFKSDRGNPGLTINPSYIISRQICAEFINIRGNHDVNNRVKSFANSFHSHLGSRYPDVAFNHYPSIDSRCDKQCLKSPIIIHGHVHRRFKHLLDLDRKILNVNAGVDVWKYQIVSEDELIEYLNKLFKMSPDQLYRCKMVNGRLQFAGNPDF